jgi:hypothetical protein
LRVLLTIHSGRALAVTICNRNGYSGQDYVGELYPNVRHGSCLEAETTIRQAATIAWNESFRDDELLIASEMTVEITMLRMAHFTVALTPDLPSSNPTIIVARVEVLLSTLIGASGYLMMVAPDLPHHDNARHHRERGGSMEQQYQLGHGLSRSPERRNHGFSGVCMSVAERRLALGHTQQFSIAASPRVPQVNSAYF